jgi:hypothetical protein
VARNRSVRKQNRAGHDGERRRRAKTRHPISSWEEPQSARVRLATSSVAVPPEVN